MDKETYKLIKERYESEISCAKGMIKCYEREIKDLEIKINSYKIQKEAFEYALKKLNEEYDK